jgi:hypothetical protein
MFAAALRETERRERAELDRARAEQAHASAVEAARRDVEQAVEAIRSAKRAGKSTVAADGAWRAAKAHLIELETGTAPTWAPAAADGATDEISSDEPSEPNHHETA